MVMMDIEVRLGYGDDGHHGDVIDMFLGGNHENDGCDRYVLRRYQVRIILRRGMVMVMMVSLEVMVM